jgi:hypothetical protein
MAWQAQLYIGVKVHSLPEAKRVLAGLGVSDFPHESKSWYYKYPEKQSKIVYKNVTYPVNVSFQFEPEGGSVISVDEVPQEEKRSYTDAIVGFPLTARYKGEILDVDEENGRPEPFEIDIEGCSDILSQVRKWWPEAQLLMWDRWH